MYIHIYMCTNMYISIYVYTYIHIFMFTYINVYIRIRILMNLYVNIYLFTYLYICIHAYIHIFICCIRIYVFEYIFILLNRKSLWSPSLSRTSVIWSSSSKIHKNTRICSSNRIHSFACVYTCIHLHIPAPFQKLRFRGVAHTKHASIHVYLYTYIYIFKRLVKR